MKTSIRVHYNDRRQGPVFETQQSEGGTLALCTKRALDKFWSSKTRKQKNDIRTTPVVKLEIYLLTLLVMP